MKHRRGMATKYEFVVFEKTTGEVAWRGWDCTKGNRTSLTRWMMTRMKSLGILLIEHIAILTNTNSEKWEVAEKAKDGMLCPDTNWVGVWTGRTNLQANGYDGLQDTEIETCTDCRKMFYRKFNHKHEEK